MTDKLPRTSPDLTRQNVERLAELFPEVVTEGTEGDGPHVDLDLLRQALSNHVVDGPNERYRLDWPGKRRALLLANTPTDKTLRPMREDSVDFDDTRNLFIEGDNLEALKLLQESYLGQIKMIYIDPPYNTGKDFIYTDRFTRSASEEQSDSGQVDETGGRLVANPESNGRFHSDWLSMMYPRLKLARNLLRRDGVIFISINERELPALSIVMKDLYGDSSHVGTITWKNVTDNNPTRIATEHESIVCFSRDSSSLEQTWKSPASDIADKLVNIGKKILFEYNDIEEAQAAYTAWFRKNKSQLGQLNRYKYIDEGGVFIGSQSVHNPGTEGYRYDVIHPSTGRPCKEPLMGYRFPYETYKKLESEGRIIYGVDHGKIIELKVYASEYQDKLSSILEIDGRKGPYDLKSLFGDKTKKFTNPKPVSLVEKLVSFATTEGDCILDFFAGSGTTAESIYSLNMRLGSSRSYISVQLDEIVREENSEHENIAQLSRERIRRAGSKILADNPDLVGKLDVGFRTLKVDSASFEDTYVRTNELTQSHIDGLVSPVKTDRTNEDLLFHALLRFASGGTNASPLLTLPIRRVEVQGRPVFLVDPQKETDEGAALLACFATPTDKAGGIDRNIGKALASLVPLRAVFRDDGFVDDATKENVHSLFTQLAPDTEVHVL